MPAAKPDAGTAAGAAVGTPGGWLSPEWLDAAAGMYGSLPDVPGATGSVNLAFVVAPRKEVAIHWRYDDGRPVEGATGVVPEPDLALSMAAADAADVVSGRVEPSVAFMRGRLKAAGDGGLLLAFLESTTAPAFEQWRERLAAIAEPPG